MRAGRGQEKVNGESIANREGVNPRPSTMSAVTEPSASHIDRMEDEGLKRKRCVVALAPLLRWATLTGPSFVPLLCPRAQVSLAAQAQRSPALATQPAQEIHLSRSRRIRLLLRRHPPSARPGCRPGEEARARAPARPSPCRGGARRLVLDRPHDHRQLGRRFRCCRRVRKAHGQEQERRSLCPAGTAQGAADGGREGQGQRRVPKAQLGCSQEVHQWFDQQGEPPRLLRVVCRPLTCTLASPSRSTSPTSNTSSPSSSARTSSAVEVSLPGRS